MLLKAFAATLLALSQISCTSIGVAASSPTALNTSTNQTYSFGLWGDMPYARNGDTHFFKMNKPVYGPAKMLTNLTRLQTFGSPHLHWVKVTVDPASQNIFQIQPVIVRQP